MQVLRIAGAAPEHCLTYSTWFVMSCCRRHILKLQLVAFRKEHAHVLC